MDCNEVFYRPELFHHQGHQCVVHALCSAYFCDSVAGFPCCIYFLKVSVLLEQDLYYVGLNKTGPRREWMWILWSCFTDQPTCYCVRSSRDIEVLSAVADKNYSSVHSYFFIQKWSKISQFWKGYELCACKIVEALQGVFNSLFPWTVAIEKRDRNPWKSKN